MDFNCSTIVLTIDGLRSSALGTYGETSYETPGFDRLASESITYDWCYADSNVASINLNKLVDEYLSQQVGLQTTCFASDDVSLLRERTLEEFSKVIPLDCTPGQSNAESIGQTQCASAITQFAEQLTEWQERAYTAEKPCHAWLHLSGLHSIWDAPQALSESLLDEEDSPISPSVAPSRLSAQDVDDTTWCESRFHASCRYAAQVMVLDACIEGLIDFLNELFEGHAWQFFLIGTSGYSLGEHGEIGSNIGNLYSEQQQVPLLRKSINPDERFSRIQNITLLSELFASTTEQLQSKSDSKIRCYSEDGKLSIRTDGWYLIHPEQPSEQPEAGTENQTQLFLKPDDRWEQNDVYKLEEATAERLLAHFNCDRSNKESN